jgi:uncharacterized membrane protein YccC
MITSTLLPTTRLAIRAVIGILIALVVSSMINLGHSWWEVLTVLLLVAPSWGENIQRSIKRFLMTIIGCSVGWGLFILAGQHALLHMIAILLCIFGMMYCLPTWYASAMFFVGILVVFLFGSLSLWDASLMLQRIGQTGIGALIVIVVSGLVFPTFSRHNFNQQVRQVLELIEINTKKLLTQHLTQNNEKANLSAALHQLSADLLALQALYQVVRYELAFSLHFSKRMDCVLVVLEVLGFYLVALQQAFCKLDHDEAKQYFKPIFEELQAHIHRRFEQLHDKLEGRPVTESPAWEERYLIDARARFIAARQTRQFTPETFVSVSSCIYYTRRLEAELTKLVQLLRPQGA